MGVLGDSASRLGKPLGCRAGTRVWCQSSRPFRSPSHSRMWSRPPGASGELPQAACIPPPCHRQAPVSPSHGIITSASRLHMQAACMASLLHRPAPQPEPSAPWLLWLLFLAPLGNLPPGCSKGNGCWQDRGPVGVSPGFWMGSELLIHGQPPWEGRARTACSLPWGGGTQDSPRLSHPWRGPALQVQVGTTNGVVERQQSGRGLQLS